MDSKLTAFRTMQLSIATLSAILATLAQASPISQSAPRSAQVNGVQAAQFSGPQFQAGQVTAPQTATVAYAQPQPQADDSDDSGDGLNLLGHAEVLNGNGINVLGTKADGGNTKRQDDSKDGLDALGHADLLNNNGINALGHEATGGDNIHGSKPAPVHYVEKPQPKPVYVENVQSAPAPAAAPAYAGPNIVGPSFSANQVSQQ